MVQGCLSFEALGLDHFSRFGMKICGIQVKLWNKKFKCGWLHWWNFVIKLLSARCLSSSLFPTGRHRSFDSLNEIRTAISSESIQLLQSYILTYKKKLEEVVFIEEGFLCKKISKKGVYVHYGATVDTSQDACSEAVWKFDSIEVGETNHYSS